MWIEIAKNLDNLSKELVTPLAGVWIEIALMVDCLTLQMVTPFAGVWIEIISVSKNHSVRNCHSPCESVD